MDTEYTHGRADFKEADAPEVMPAHTLAELKKEADDMLQPEIILGPFQTGTWGFLVGPPGIGKSMLIMKIAEAIVTGGRCGPWSAPKRNDVLILDAEMSPIEIIGRWGSVLPDGVRYVTAHSLGIQKHFNLGTDLERLKATRRPSETTVIVDNVEFSLDPPEGKGMFDYETWKQVHPILNWAKSNGILLILVDHTNKEGILGGQRNKQRGTNFIVMLETHYVEDSILSFSTTMNAPKGKFRGIAEKKLIQDTNWWMRDNNALYSEPKPTVKQEVEKLIDAGVSRADAARIIVPAITSKSNFYRLWMKLNGKP